MLGYIIIFTIIGSILSLIGGVLLLFKKHLSETLVLDLTSFAAGVLLATAFIDLFPEAISGTENHAKIFVYALSGMIVFFTLERFFLWFHHHHETTKEIRPSVLLITIGDSIHNFIDGVAITSSFLVSFPLGVTTALAVAAHEIPQEIADFSVLLSQKVSKFKTLAFNGLSALTSLLGAIITYYLAERITVLLPYIISFTAGMFIYIAASDLIPELHRSSIKKTNAWHQTATLLFGIFLVSIIKSLINE
ncbi:hypothetical protein A3D78_05710 [Candidatus Gottesmanbacteria bacterium RIFCSPHIGHO2_02_FULL_39_14]|uniref:ZIP zinc transporter n=2 Tax=Candidatus Gottesmaniibacteriota TaxID=1752720 RepID=A0A1F6A326_9BACT|nr:MAG: hypothetical protein A3D78_05710 [Candidatus Gottesmanbacteria bacterium RIFCSPHIGHO2_02_FULL_39_14]OGG31202.1 MAG: hypothetical protein A3I51_04960 [Candidatus Gottesmanbacteria bacterium RIFCSPLOWO2_02_FULL_38_8]